MATPSLRQRHQNPEKRGIFCSFLLIFKIRSCTVRSDLKNKIPRFSGKNLGGRFGNFLFFFCSGAGEKEEASKEVAGRFLIKNRGRGGGFRGGGVGGGRALGECLWGEGGGANFFFSGPKFPPSIHSKKFAATFQGEFLTRRNVLRRFFVLRRFWGASIEKVSPLKSSYSN